MGLGYNFEALKQTAEVVTKQTDNGPVNVYIDTVNKFYVFDFDGEQEIYKSATTLYYGQIEYTLIVKDAQGNIIDFAKGSLDRFPND